MESGISNEQYFSFPFLFIKTVVRNDYDLYNCNFIQEKKEKKEKKFKSRYWETINPVEVCGQQHQYQEKPRKIKKTMKNQDTQKSKKKKKKMKKRREKKKKKKIYI